jgi:hypothetical protein
LVRCDIGFFEQDKNREMGGESAFGPPAFLHSTN